MDKRLLENSMADNGVEYINDTELHESPTLFVGLMVTDDITIESIVTESDVTGNSLAGAILPIGNYPIRFSSIKLTLGTAFAVKGV